MSIIMSNNWENHFKDHPSNEVRNKTMSALLSRFNLTTPADCLAYAIEEQETVFLAQAPITHHILFLHHFHKIGVTRTSPNTKHFTLSGYGPSAYPKQVTNVSMFAESNHQVPSWVAFTSITNSSSVNGLTTHLNDTICSYRNFILISPFLAAALMYTCG